MQLLKHLSPIALSAVFAASTAWAQTAPVLYTANPEQAIETVKDEARKVQLPVSVITGGTGVLMRRLDAEKSKPQGDVFWSASAATMGSYAHLFTPYTSPQLQAIPAQYHYPDNLILPTNVHVVALMVNTELLGGEPAPTRWADLADPKWRGKIVMADPNNSATSHTIAWGLYSTLDEATYKAIVANMTVTQSASSVRRGVAQGEYAVGLMFEAHAYSYVAGGQEEIKVVYPEEGTFISPEYLAVVKDAPTERAAQQLADLLLARETQIELLQSSYRRPSRADIKVSDYENLPELADIKTVAIDEQEAARTRTQFLAEWDALPKADS